jgi:pimeloyl-ACP methyl ester carboxylesterase
MNVLVASHETTIHFDAVGPNNASQVLVLHGWGSSKAVMSTLIQGLAKHFRVFSLDLPGHGRSPISPVPWGLPEQASAVSQFLQEHAAGAVTLIGHSNGGRIGLFMASEDALSPQINGLVLFSPSGIRRTPGLKTRMRRLAASVLKAPFALLPPNAREYGLDWLRHTLIWSLLGSSDYRALGGIMRQTFVLTVNAYVEERLGAIHVPVLVFWGNKDEDIVLEQMQKLEADIHDAGIVVIQDAGHYAFLDRPDMAIDGTVQFVESL